MGDVNIGSNIEIGVFNYAIKQSKIKKIVKKWDNTYFVQLYLYRTRTVLYNLKNKELFNSIKCGDIKSHHFAIMTHQEMTEGPAKGTIMEAKMSDYQEVEGLYMPFSMTQGIKDQPGQALIIKSIEINTVVDDSNFKFPETVSEEENN